MKRLAIIMLLFVVLLTTAYADVSIPSDCTDDEIKATWDSVFVDSISSDDIIIYTNEQTRDEKCEKFFAKKNSGELYYFLIGYVVEVDIEDKIINKTGIYARYTNLTSDGITTLNGITTIELAEENLFPTIEGIFTYEDESFFTTNINLRENALTQGSDTEFAIAFKESPDSWDDEDEEAGNIVYKYSDNQSTSTEKIYYTGSLNNNYTYNSFAYSYRLLSTGEEDEDDSGDALCTPNWQCTGWGDCNDEIQTRTCTDANDCNVTTNKPTESQSCTPPCTPNWQCTEWAPEKCPKEEIQTRTCTDANDCGKEGSKPSESQSCVYESHLGSIIFYIFIGVGIIIVVVVAIFIVKGLMKKNGEKGSGGYYNIGGGAGGGGSGAGSSNIETQLVDDSGNIVEETV